MVFRCVIAGALFALTYNAQIPTLEYVWARIMTYYPGYPSISYSHGKFGVGERHYVNRIVEVLYSNELTWNKPKKNYGDYGNGKHVNRVVLSIVTRCTYFQVWVMIVPFFVTRRTVWSVVKAVLIAGLFASSMNLVRLTLNTALVYQDVPWWLAHDVPNVILGLDTIGLSIGYYLRTLRIAEAAEGQKAERSLSEASSVEQVAADVSMQAPDPYPAG